MVQTITFSDFTDAFHRMDRGEQFSYGALRLLFDYLDNIEPEYSLDVVGLCCEFTESTPEEVVESYSLAVSDPGDPEECLNVALDYLQEQTTVLGTTGEGVLYMSSF